MGTLQSDGILRSHNRSQYMDDMTRILTKIYRPEPMLVKQLLAGVILLVLSGGMSNVLAANDPCYGLTYEGSCDGDVAQWCENNEIIQVDCSNQGLTCQWNEEANEFGCSELVEIANTCTLPQEGHCSDATVVVWCDEAGKMNELQCEDGMICGWNPENNYFDCVPEESGGQNQSDQESSQDGTDSDEESLDSPSDRAKDPVKQAQTVSEDVSSALGIDGENEKLHTGSSFPSISSGNSSQEGGCTQTGLPFLVFPLLFLLIATVSCHPRKTR